MVLSAEEIRRAVQAALAEDIVMERAERSLCPYVEQPEVATP